MLLEGIFLPITTPFHADGRVYPRKLASNVEHYSRTPAAGLLVLSDVGEAAGLTDEETRIILATVSHAAAKDKVLIASVGRESVFATLELARFAHAEGFDAIAVNAPSIALDRTLQVELLTYFRAIADASPLPVLIAGEPFAEADLVALADHPNILGALLAGEPTPEHIASLRAATTAVSREVTVTPVFAAATRRMLAEALVPAQSFGGVAVLETRPAVKTRTKRVGFQVLTTSTSGMLASWTAGASGAAPRLGPCAPQACYEVWQAFKDEDPPLAAEKQERLRAVAARITGPAGIGMLKYGCDFNGYYGGLPRLPLLGPTAADRASLETLLSGMRN